MKILTSLLGGLAGSLTLNLMHETFRHLGKNAPRVDLVGEEAVNKIRGAAGAEPLEGGKLYATALAGDIISNALYFSLAGLSNRHTVTTGAVAGAAAGIGAVCLTNKLGLDDEPITRNETVKWRTVAYYTIGGVAAGISIKLMRKALMWAEAD